MMSLVVDTNIVLASVGTAAPYRWLFDALLQEKCRVIPAQAGIQHNDRASAEYLVATRCYALDSRLRGNDNIKM